VNDQLLDAVEHAARLARLERRKARARDLRVEVALEISDAGTAVDAAMAALDELVRRAK
jgi:hypothetical protein